MPYNYETQTSSPRINTISSKEWLSHQPAREWLSLNSIPPEIFKSVWAYIETKKVELHSKKPVFKTSY